MHLGADVCKLMVGGPWRPSILDRGERDTIFPLKCCEGPGLRKLRLRTHMVAILSGIRNTPHTEFHQYPLRRPLRKAKMAPGGGGRLLRQCLVPLT